MPLSVCIAFLHFFSVPRVFGFVYVQTVFYTVSSYLGLVGKKDDIYDKVALFIFMPNLPMTWVESMTCDSFLVNYGGHLWYDFMIPLSIFVYFLHLWENPKVQ